MSYTAAHVSSSAPTQLVACTRIVCIPFSVSMVPTFAVTVRVRSPLRASPLSRRRDVNSPARKEFVESGQCGAFVFHRAHFIILAELAIIYRLETAQNPLRGAQSALRVVWEPEKKRTAVAAARRKFLVDVAVVSRTVEGGRGADAFSGTRTEAGTRPGRGIS